MPKLLNLEAAPKKRTIQHYDLEKMQMTDYGLNNSVKKEPINLRTTYSIESQYAKLIAYEKSLRGSHPMLNRCL
jgi:hypothetical protein